MNTEKRERRSYRRDAEFAEKTYRNGCPVCPESHGTDRPLQVEFKVKGAELTHISHSLAEER